MIGYFKVFLGLNIKHGFLLHYTINANNGSYYNLQALEQVKLAENEVLEYKKKIAEAESKLKQQQGFVK